MVSKVYIFSLWIILHYHLLYSYLNQPLMICELELIEKVLKDELMKNVILLLRLTLNHI